MDLRVDDAPRGVFEWKRRMGVHEAYHQNGTNRLLHWVFIPLELWAVVKLLSLVPLVGGVDLALVAIALAAPVYLATEAVMGAAMCAFLVACWASARHTLAHAPVTAALFAAAFFAATFTLQLRVGHGVFERGRDDTEQNIAEFLRTKNPVPLLLVFYYHLVELFLAAGYRPEIARTIAYYTAREREARGLG